MQQKRMMRSAPSRAQSNSIILLTTQTVFLFIDIGGERRKWRVAVAFLCLNIDLDIHGYICLSSGAAAIRLSILSAFFLPSPPFDLCLMTFPFFSFLVWFWLYCTFFLAWCFSE